MVHISNRRRSAYTRHMVHRCTCQEVTTYLPSLTLHIKRHLCDAVTEKLSETREWMDVGGMHGPDSRPLGWVARMVKVAVRTTPV